MSGFGNTRSAAQHDRVPSTSFSRRGPTSRASARPSSSGEVVPDDSASNASHRRAVSGTSRINGTLKSHSERQTSKVQLTTRENVDVRTRSPEKSSFTDGAEKNNSSGLSRQDGHMSSRGVPGFRHEKRVLCRITGSSEL